MKNRKKKITKPINNDIDNAIQNVINAAKGMLNGKHIPGYAGTFPLTNHPHGHAWAIEYGELKQALEIYDAIMQGYLNKKK